MPTFFLEVAKFIKELIVVVMTIIFGANTDDPSEPSAQVQEWFLYQQHSTVTLTLEDQIGESFYRVNGYDEQGQTVRLKKESCINDQIQYEATEYDFAGCLSGSYYRLPNHDSDGLAAKAVETKGIINQAVTDVAQQQILVERQIESVRSQMRDHTRDFEWHRGEEARNRSDLRSCPWWDGGCHSSNFLAHLDIFFHKLNKAHHLKMKNKAEKELKALETSENQLTAAQGQVLSAQQKIQTFEASVTRHDNGSIALPSSKLGDGVHWMKDYKASVIRQSGDSADFKIAVECPLNPQICQQATLNNDYSVLFQFSGLGSESAVDTSLEYDESQTPQWILSVDKEAVFGPQQGLSSDVNVEEHEFALSLALNYNVKGASGVGSSAASPQIVQYGKFDHVKYSGVLKGRGHHGDIEKGDDQGRMRWQRVKPALYFSESSEHFLPKEDFGDDGSYALPYDEETSGRLIDLVLADFDEDGLDEMLSVYSNGKETKLIYGMNNGRDNGNDQLPPGFVSADNEQKMASWGHVVNVDRVQLIQGAHHVYGQQDGVNYLLLHSVAESKLYPVALVQPKDVAINSYASMKVVEGEPISNALAMDGIWLNDPAYGFAGGNELLLSWLMLPENNHHVQRGTYVHRPYFSVKPSVKQQSYALTTTAGSGDELSYQLAVVDDSVPKSSALDLQSGDSHLYVLNGPGLGCELSTTYSAVGDFSLRLINDPATQGEQLSAVVSASSACKLVRAMDPYHRGKTDRLLVQNHQQTLTAWSGLDIPSSPDGNRLPEKDFAFHMDYNYGAYQKQSVVTQADLEAAADELSLNDTLQSQLLSTDDPDEKDNLSATLTDYCKKQHLEDKNCLFEWLKTAIDIDSDESEFADCRQHQALGSQFVDCLEGKIITPLFKDRGISSMKTRHHEFTYSYDARPIIRRQSLSSGQTIIINLDDLFVLFKTMVSLDGTGTGQVSYDEHQHSSLPELAREVINGLVPKAYAGAEFAACVATGPGLPECAAIIGSVTLFATVGLALAAHVVDEMTKANAEDPQSTDPKEEVFSPTTPEINLTIHAAQPYNPKRIFFCPNENETYVTCDKDEKNSGKITINLLGDRFSILFIPNSGRLQYLEISNDDPTYRNIMDLYNGGESKLSELIENIIDSGKLDKWFEQLSKCGDNQQCVDSAHEEGNPQFIIRTILQRVVKRGEFPIQDKDHLKWIEAIAGVRLEESVFDRDQREAIQLMTNLLVILDIDSLKDYAEVSKSFGEQLKSLSCEVVCDMKLSELQDAQNKLGDSLNKSAKEFFDKVVPGLADYLLSMDETIGNQEKRNLQSWNKELNKVNNNTQNDSKAAASLEKLRALLDGREDIDYAVGLTYPAGKLYNGRFMSFQDVQINYDSKGKTLGLYLDDVNSGVYYFVEITKDTFEVRINQLRLSDAWALDNDIYPTTDLGITKSDVLAYVDRLITSTTDFLEGYEQITENPGQEKSTILELEKNLTSSIQQTHDGNGSENTWGRHLEGGEEQIQEGDIELSELDSGRPIVQGPHEQENPNNPPICGICERERNMYRQELEDLPCCQREVHGYCAAMWGLRGDRPSTCPLCHSNTEIVRNFFRDQQVAHRLETTDRHIGMLPLSRVRDGLRREGQIRSNMLAAPRHPVNPHEQLLSVLSNPLLAFSQLPFIRNNCDRQWCLFASLMLPLSLTGSHFLLQWYGQEYDYVTFKLVVPKSTDYSSQKYISHASFPASSPKSGVEPDVRYDFSDRDVIYTCNPNSLLRGNIFRPGCAKVSLRYPGHVIAYANIPYNKEDREKEDRKDESRLRLNVKIRNVAAYDDTDLRRTSLVSIYQPTHPFAVISNDYQNFAEYSPQLQKVTINSLLPVNDRDSSVKDLDFSHNFSINMMEMFANTKSYNQGDVINWNVEKVDNMARMFKNAKGFRQDISSWDVSNVKHYEDFSDGSNLIDYQIPKFSEIPSP
jgi:hypothetical protein